MAEIKAFRGLRFTRAAGPMEELACPPYDIISEEERLAFLRRNPHNIIRLELPREGEDPYAQAGETLRAWLADGVLRCDGDPALYLYEEEFTVRGETKRIRGLTCLVKLEEWEKGVVLPHEETLRKAKEDRFQLMKATGCNFSQIYSLYHDESGKTGARIDALCAGTPRQEFSDGAVTHRLWVVNDPVAIRAFCEEFEGRKLYIADGHHRYETALRYRDWRREQGLPCGDFVLMTLVDLESPGLVVFPTHRLVHGLPDFDAEAVVRACGAAFDCAPCGRMDEMAPALDALYRQGKKAFAFYAGGGSWTLLTLRDPEAARALLPGKSEAYCGLDVTVLHTLVLERVLGMDAESMARQEHLRYTRSMEEALASVDRGESQCAFLLNPTRVSEIRGVAAAGEKMPQKSTYFYPKLITGLVMNLI